MSYREPARISKLGTVLRYYAAIIESGALAPPPEHLLLPHETVEAFRYLAMVLDLEAGERLAGLDSANGGEAGGKVARQSLPDFEQRFRRLAVASNQTDERTGPLPGGKALPDLGLQIERRRQVAEVPDGAATEEGEGGGTGSRLAPGLAPRSRRRRGPQ